MSRDVKMPYGHKEFKLNFIHLAAMFVYIWSHTHGNMMKTNPRDSDEF
jgi:hypothetical protein